MTLSVIIPNWNGKHLLKACLSSLKNQTLKNFEVMVVDNGSKDGSLEYLKENFPEVRLIELEKNYGFAKAVNEGIKTARSKYLILLNNDTEADKNYLKFLVEAARMHPEAGFIAAKMLNFQRRNIIDSAGDAVDIVGHSYNIGLGKKDGPEFNKEGYVFLATAGGSLFKREVFDKVGLFDEDYGTYMEDIDLCLRAQIQGFKGWYTPYAVLYHMRKATSSKIIAKSEYWHFRNMTQNIIKDYPNALFWRDFNWLKILMVNINTVWYMIKKGLIWQAFLAETYILLNLPKLLQKRSKIQKSKVVSDDYIIQNIRPKKITFWGLKK
ncbi:glycosyltransferase family 2 protein [Patescibacteria group bacterium]|nr:glycosyltransferase family 2 protein [Patescibacteria group bacterium]